MTGVDLDEGVVLDALNFKTRCIANDAPAVGLARCRVCHQGGIFLCAEHLGAVAARIDELWRSDPHVMVCVECGAIQTTFAASYEVVRL